VSVDSKIGAIHSAKVAAATFLGFDDVRWMIALGVKSGRKSKNVSGTELYAEAAGLTTFDFDFYGSLRHSIL
jgi:hypothetical protein